MKHKFKAKEVCKLSLNYSRGSELWIDSHCSVVDQIFNKKKKKKLKFCLLFLSTGYKCWKIFDILCRYLSSRYRIYVLIIWQKSLCMIYLFFMINLDIPKPVFNNSIIFKKNISAVSGAIAYSTSVSYCSISILSQPQ